MNIAILGAKDVGSTLGRRFSEVGHTVRFGVRSPSDYAQSGLAGPVGTVNTAVLNADIIVLALPFASAPAALAECGELNGKIIIDATNPLAMGDHGLYLTAGFDDSGAEQIARHASGAHVVKCFNSTSYMNMADARGSMMFVCGEEPESNEAVRNLSNEIGFDTVNIGGLKQARLLEPLAMLFIHLAFTTELKWDFALKLDRK